MGRHRKSQITAALAAQEEGPATFLTELKDATPDILKEINLLPKGEEKMAALKMFDKMSMCLDALTDDKIVYMKGKELVSSVKEIFDMIQSLLGKKGPDTAIQVNLTYYGNPPAGITSAEKV